MSYIPAEHQISALWVMVLVLLLGLPTAAVVVMAGVFVLQSFNDRSDG